MSRRIYIGGIAIGGGAPVTVQSMTNTDTRDAEATAAQAKRLAEAGCDIIRIAIFDEDCLPAIERTKKEAGIPVVADIHFRADLAVMAAEHGADKLRINPGNIGDESRIKLVADAARTHHIPIRVGVNSGSLEKELYAKYGFSARTMASSAIENIRELEKCGFYDIVVAAKSTDVRMTVETARMLAAEVDYPIHVGVTETGLPEDGIIKSAIGIGSLLLDGIGDTLRVSLTGDPIREVETGLQILSALGIRRRGPEIISCPTCGRCRWDVEGTARAVREKLKGLDYPIKVAVMGCIVNGPGESKNADIGVAGGDGWAMIFKHGEPYKRVAADKAADALTEEIIGMYRGI